MSKSLPNSRRHRTFIQQQDRALNTSITRNLIISSTSTQLCNETTSDWPDDINFINVVFSTFFLLPPAHNTGTRYTGAVYFIVNMHFIHIRTRALTSYELLRGRNIWVKIAVLRNTRFWARNIFRRR